MTHLFSDESHWSLRADEARAMAELITDPDAKRAMLEIAANYEKIAKRAEARDAGVSLPESQRNGSRAAQH